MPWTVAIAVDPDQTKDGEEVGTVTAIFTDDSLFTAPFSMSERAQFTSAKWPSIVDRFRSQLAAETARRQGQSKLEASLTAMMNG